MADQQRRQVIRPSRPKRPLDGEDARNQHKSIKFADTGNTDLPRKRVKPNGPDSVDVSASVRTIGISRPAAEQAGAAAVPERAELRKQRNRESAALSRERSRTYIHALEEEIARLQARIVELEAGTQHAQQRAESEPTPRPVSGGTNADASAAAGASTGSDPVPAATPALAPMLSSHELMQPASVPRQVWNSYGFPSYLPPPSASLPSGLYNRQDSFLSVGGHGMGPGHPGGLGSISAKASPMLHGRIDSYGPLGAGSMSIGMNMGMSAGIGLGSAGLALPLSRSHSFQPESAGATPIVPAIPPAVAALAPPGRGSGGAKGKGPSRTGSYGSTGMQEAELLSAHQSFERQASFGRHEQHSHTGWGRTPSDGMEGLGGQVMRNPGGAGANAMPESSVPLPRSHRQVLASPARSTSSGGERDAAMLLAAVHQYQAEKG